MTAEAPRGFRGVFRSDDSARAVYAEAAGIARIWPKAVAVAADADDVATIVRWASDTRQPLIPRGSGSSMAGGAIGDGVVLDLSRLRALSDVDVARRSIRAEVGVLRGELNRHASANRTDGGKLRFPVDPSSGEFCTIGGMTATNAAGPHSLLHGAMRRWVVAVDCVFDDGSRATIRRGEPLRTGVPAVRRFVQHAAPVLLKQNPGIECPRVIKNSSGYGTDAYAESHELVDLLVGSEGTLAVFTAVEVALTPVAGASASVLVSFRDLERAVEAAVASRDQGASACELLDRTFLTIAAKAGRPLPVSSDAEAALLVEIEASHSTAATAQIDLLRDLFRKLDAADLIVAGEGGATQEAELWSFRHAASPAIARMDASLRSMQFIEDAAVPPTQLAAYVRDVRSILEKAETTGVIFGHAGDAHVHVNPLLNVGQPDWRARVERILLEVTDLVARLGGTLTGEHGDGRLRTPLMSRIWSSPAIEQFALLKRIFDPAGIFNPGVKVPLPGQRAIDVVKYDPTLEALPAPARSALETVERERAYSRFRLDLL